MVGMAIEMYKLIENFHTLYDLLQDELSKEIFMARLACDIEPSAKNSSHLVSFANTYVAKFREWDELKQLNRENKKIILYGCGGGGLFYAGIFQGARIDFYGFCDRAAEKFPDGLLGKPVLSPDDLAAHKDEYYVLPTAYKERVRTEIYEFLEGHNYPKDHILSWIPDWIDDLISTLEDKQYFEFPELYRKGTAFINCGCYDGEVNYKFAEWCGGEYSSIVAFEPDPNNYEVCRKREQDDPLLNSRLINAGLSDKEGTAEFEALGTGSSSIALDDLRSRINSTDEFNRDKAITIRITTIDDCVEDCKVGFIKMDIEGAEFDALHGAQNTIRRDKPFLAICVYHLRGDMVAIMDYLHQLVPEYRFLLRHYGLSQSETVLYASIDL